MKNTPPFTNQSGFTLIELMIVVGIVAILAAIAAPSYQAFVLDGRRAEGQAFALDIASRQERFFTENNGYSTVDVATVITDLQLPNGAASENGAYTLTAIGNNGGTGYLITVTPAVADGECGFLRLDNLGVRESENGDAAECWR